ncbi:hypothetical protein C8R44DRAFT_738820 [Mycena epipterygia]|nr:hypothetical protein C8R44DRAFT_738820 [Mycena epipterygia]
MLGSRLLHALLCSLRLFLPGTGESQLAWRQRSCVPATPDPLAPGISYSGHTQAPMSSAGSQEIYPPEINDVPILVGETWEDRTSLYLAPYSGGLTSFMGSTFVLCYFG